MSLYEMEWHYYSQCMSISAVHSQIRHQVSFSHSYLVFQVPVSLLTYLTDMMVNCPSKLLNRSLTANATIFFQVIEGRSIRDWKTLMSVTKNKQALFRFIGDFIVQKRGESFRSISNGDDLYLAGIFSDPLFIKGISTNGVSECEGLHCSHDEADTRMIFHATHADNFFCNKHIRGRIIIRSPDTVVLLLAVRFF